MLRLKNRIQFKIVKKIVLRCFCSVTNLRITGIGIQGLGTSLKRPHHISACMHLTSKTRQKQAKQLRTGRRNPKGLRKLSKKSNPWKIARTLHIPILRYAKRVLTCCVNGLRKSKLLLHDRFVLKPLVPKIPYFFNCKPTLIA